MADQPLRLRTFDECGMHPLGELAASELGEARENTLSSGTCNAFSQPHRRRKVMSWAKRSNNARVCGKPKTALARKPRAMQARSCRHRLKGGGRQAEPPVAPKIRKVSTGNTFHKM